MISDRAFAVIQLEASKRRLSQRVFDSALSVYKLRFDVLQLSQPNRSPQSIDTTLLAPLELDSLFNQARIRVDADLKLTPKAGLIAGIRNRTVEFLLAIAAGLVVVGLTPLVSSDAEPPEPAVSVPDGQQIEQETPDQLLLPPPTEEDAPVPGPSPELEAIESSNMSA